MNILSIISYVALLIFFPYSKIWLKILFIGAPLALATLCTTAATMMKEELEICPVDAAIISNTVRLLQIIMPLPAFCSFK